MKSNSVVSTVRADDLEAVAAATPEDPSINMD